jgi:hypothetical protein
VFLLVINTNALSFKGCDEYGCGYTWDPWWFAGCYWDNFGQPLEWGRCDFDQPPNIRICYSVCMQYSCSFEGMKWCCNNDPTRICKVIGEDEGEELDMQYEEPPRRR